MVSALSVCLLAIGITAASSQMLSPEVESSDAPVSDRRTFKHGKPPKLVPFVKKHKKFGGIVPHVFSKPSYSEVTVFHEAPRPVYKFHRYQGVEAKPLPEISISTPEPFIETHSVEPPTDYAPAFDHSFSALSHSSNILLLPINDKPIFSAPSFSSPHPGPVFSSLPPPPPKPIFSFVPASPQPVIPSLPITAVPSVISVARPAPTPVFPQAPAFPIFTSIPIKVQPPVLPALPSPTPAPVFSPAPIKIPAPVIPASPSPPVFSPSPAPAFSPSPAPVFSPSPAPVFSPSPAPVFSPSPAPVFSPSPAPVFSPSPAPVFSASPAPPVFSTVSVTPPPLAHAFPSIPPPALPSIPAPSPIPISFQALPSPAPTFSSISASPEPEFPYPPSGVPIPSYIKDISLGDVEIKDPLPTLETPKYQEVTPAVVDNPPQGIKHITPIKTDDGLLHKLKGWKSEKASAALNHFSNFKQNPFAAFSLPFSHTSNKVPLEIPSSPAPVYPSLQFPAPIHPLPLAQAPPVFFPPSPSFFPPAKYESFPPNNDEHHPVLNSYGVPISHDFPSAHASHDRLSAAASEEEPSVVAAPKEQTTVQKPDLQQRPSAQLLQEFQTQNFQNQFVQPTQHVQPIYVPEEKKTVKEDVTGSEDTQPEVDDYNVPKEPETEDHTYRNHKE